MRRQRNFRTPGAAVLIFLLASSKRHRLWHDLEQNGTAKGTFICQRIRARTSHRHTSALGYPLNRPSTTKAACWWGYIAHDSSTTLPRSKSVSLVHLPESPVLVLIAVFEFLIYLPPLTRIACCRYQRTIELELKLTQTRIIQKSLLWVAAGKRAWISHENASGLSLWVSERLLQNTMYDIRNIQQGPPSGLRLPVVVVW
jgi:hypothetical protein